MGLWNRIKGIFGQGTPSAADDRWYGPAIGPETNAGAKVDYSSVLGIPAVWACTRIIAESIASLPLFLYTRKDRGKDRAVNHPLYTLLHDRPNPEMSAMSFRETQTYHLLHWGNLFAEKEMDALGRVRALWPLPPDRVEIRRNLDTEEIYYRVRLEDSGLSKDLRREQMLHVPGLSYNGIVGISPITKMREALGFALATEEFGARFFGAGTHPGVVVSHPGRLSETASKNLRDSLSTTYGGLGKSHRLMLLEEAMKIEKIGFSPEDSQFLQTRAFELAEICRIWRVPLHLVQEYSKGTSYASNEQQSLEFVIHTLRPWLVRLEQGYNNQLFLTELERKRYFFEHLVDGLLRGDLKSRYDAYAVGRSWGWLSANDVREIENLNPLPDDKGDIYLQPANMIEAGAPPPEPEPAPPISESPDEENPETVRDFWKSLAFKDLFQDAIGQILSREANNLKKINDKANGDWSELVEEYYSLEVQEFMARKMTPVIQAFIYQQSKFPNAELINEATWFFVQDHIAKSKELLQSSPDREKVLTDFSGRASALATQAMVAITRWLGEWEDGI